MSEFNESAFANWSDLDIDEQCGLQVFAFRVVSELFAASGNFNEFCLKWGELLSVVFRILSLIRRYR